MVSQIRPRPHQEPGDVDVVDSVENQSFELQLQNMLCLVRLQDRAQGSRETEHRAAVRQSTGQP